MNKHSLIKGTIILTIAGILTRIIGFFYRIYLSNAMGAELLGIYQLIFPVYSLCFTIYASGLQTSISRIVAAEASKGHTENVRRILKIGILLSVVSATALSVLIYTNSNFIAVHLLNEIRSESSLKILAIVFPFCGITACINGYYYGLRKTMIPASTQLIEQIVRVLFIYLVVGVLGRGDIKATLDLAVYGLVIGEIASNLYNIASIIVTKKTDLTNTPSNSGPNTIESHRSLCKELLRLTIPLTGNRLALSLLHSFEAILIPLMLRRYGFTNAESLSSFGVLNGMAMPFIMFPSAITNALAVLLLPTISEAQALGNHRLIGKTTTLAIKYTLIIGVFSTGIFVFFGMPLGTIVYDNETAGEYLRLMALLCPFLYLTTTLGSIINGLGKATVTFYNSVIGTTLRIVIIVLLVPNIGVYGYLVGLLLSQLTITLLDGRAILKETNFNLDTANSLAKPFIIVFFCGLLILKLYEYFSEHTSLNQLVILLSSCIILCAIFLGFMLMFKAISREDFSH